MSEFGGFEKHQNNPASTKKCQVFRMLKLYSIRKKKRKRKKKKRKKKERKKKKKEREKSLSDFAELQADQQLTLSLSVGEHYDSRTCKARSTNKRTPYDTDTAGKAVVVVVGGGGGLIK